MSQQSNIEWTDATWNPVRGCVKVSPGCANCYAETFAERFRGVPGHPYEQGFDLRLVPEKLAEPLSWKKPRRVFVNSMSDLFQDGVPDEYIDQVFAVMALAPRHTFQVLTKRPERMRAYLAPGQYRDVRVADAAKALHTTVKPFALPSERVFDARRVAFNQSWLINAWPLPNVWLGVSVENQHFADERIPLLLQTPAAVRFISAEPLLGPVNLRQHFFSLEHVAHPGLCRRCGRGHGFTRCPNYGSVSPTDTRRPVCDRFERAGGEGIDWVIVGGESGPGARPFDVAWARSIVKQCRAAGVKVFVKQLGADVRDAGANRDDMGARDVWPAGEELPDGRWLPIVGNRKGGDMAEWPVDLRVREFPPVHA